MKAFIVGGDKEILNFLPELEITDKLKDAKLVIFGDGPVVSPSLYQEKKLPDVEFKCDINRDRADKAIYTKMKPDQIALGIGRGACFLAVMNGAKLIQHVYRRNVNSSYFVRLRAKDKFYDLPAISDWTQAIVLMDCTDYSIKANSQEGKDYTTSDGKVRQFMRVNGNPEFVVFNKAKQPMSICIQFHPEWMPESSLSKTVKQFIYECINS